MFNNLELKKGEIYLILEIEVYFILLVCKVVGIVIFVFFFCSEKSFGVGDFGDLKKLIDWVVKIYQ